MAEKFNLINANKPDSQEICFVTQGNYKNFIKTKGPSLLEVKINNGALDNLSRPKNLIKIKERFMVN